MVLTVRQRIVVATVVGIAGAVLMHIAGAPAWAVTMTFWLSYLIVANSARLS